MNQNDERKNMPRKGRLKSLFLFAVFVLIVGLLINYVLPLLNRQKILEQIITCLEADSRIAEVIVTDSSFDETSGKTLTTIKFLEYNVDGLPLTPQYFTFAGNIIQFQSLVIRFKDALVRQGEGMRGKSAYLFWKVFMLDGDKTEEYEITSINSVPDGYQVSDTVNKSEQIIWKEFWEYALTPERRNEIGIKNAQIEAPGTLFVPGTLYTIKIEHDGGIRIDTEPLPEIVRGEHLPQ